MRSSGQFPQFDRFRDKIAKLSAAGPNTSELEEFLIEQDGRTRIYYAPFDYVNLNAKVVIVGITPGHHSMMNGFREATAALGRGESEEETLRLAKQAGSFSNMKFTIAEMLDEIGMQSALGIHSCSELFVARYDLLHTTSCIRYPVFAWNARERSWVNYSGHSPRLGKWRTALRFADEMLLQEFRAIPEALIVPCGEAVDELLKQLANRGLVEESRCLFGFPHASGLNGHRKRLFFERKATLIQRVRDWSDHTSL